jgi:1-acyl-sn-glycerol-3-phosphate acyltransferase
MKRSPFIYALTKLVSQLVFSVFYKIEAKRNTPLPEGPVIILPKHQNWTDIPLVGLAFHRPLYFVAKKELFRYPLLRQYISLGGGIPVDREKSIRTLDSFKMIIALLKANEKIVIFPEGTYFKNIVGAGKSRLLRMILKFQEELKQKIPFVPVGIRYGEKKGWRRQVEICIGSPLFAERESDASSLTDRVMEEISCLCQLPRYTTSNSSV